MRIALISDIHANWEALQAVTKEVEREKPDMIIHLGDVVGYGADPVRCCRWVKENCTVSLLGNHDAVVVGKMDTYYFSPHARIAIQWTADQIDLECREWIASLPFNFGIDEFLFSHGSPVNPENFDYILDYDMAGKAFEFLKKTPHKILFVGHSHKSFILELNDDRISFFNVNGSDIEEFTFEKEKYYIVSVGSVGQPRDYDPRAYYAILDIGKKYFIARRVAYDIAVAAEKIKNAGLPELLADRLFQGR